MRPAIAQRASTIAECTDISVFAPKINDDGTAQPVEWFGLDPAAGEDSAEEITSSDEGEDDEGEEGEDVEPTGEAGSQPQPDRASGNKARASAPSADAVIMPRFASRPLLQPALPSPLTCPARQSLRRLNLPSLFFPACCLLNNFIKLAQFHPLGVYSNYVECWPFEGLLCKYDHVRVWFPFVYAFYP